MCYAPVKLQWTQKFNWKANRYGKCRRKDGIFEIKDILLLVSCLDYLDFLIQNVVVVSKFWVVLEPLFTQGNNCRKGEKKWDFFSAFFLCWQVKMDGRNRSSNSRQLRRALLAISNRKLWYKSITNFVASYLNKNLSLSKKLATE